MQVEEITLMNTIFIRWDGHRILCPNSKLSTDLFTNVTRSQKKGESYKASPDKFHCALGHSPWSEVLSSMKQAARLAARMLSSLRLCRILQLSDIIMLKVGMRECSACTRAWGSRLLRMDACD